jgi:hypothetical protein
MVRSVLWQSKHTYMNNTNNMSNTSLITNHDGRGEVLHNHGKMTANSIKFLINS